MKHLPNALTCGNLLCGCIGILMLPYSPPEVAAYFVWAACLFDFFDGFTARWVGASSPIGKELDSLADMVSFGVLPALLMYSLLQPQLAQPQLAFVSLSIAVFSALRLAKFNTDDTQKDSFSGLPVPANALFITGLVFLPAFFQPLLSNPFFLVGATLIFSFFLVAPMPLFALKFKNFKWADNGTRFVFIGLSAVLLLLLRAGSIPLIILLYIAISLVSRVLNVR